MEYIAVLNNYLEYSLDDNQQKFYLSKVLACMSLMLQYP